jgi:hypothetical protein
LRIATRLAAVLVSVPVAFGALDINSAMNLKVVGVDRSELRAAQNSTSGVLPMFTTHAFREQFL